MEEIVLDELFVSVSSQLGPLKNIFEMVFKKQARDMGLGGTISPKEADELADRVSKAMEFFAGPKMKKEINRLMKAEIRRRAPEYFKKRYGI